MGSGRVERVMEQDRHLWVGALAFLASMAASCRSLDTPPSEPSHRHATLPDRGFVLIRGTVDAQFGTKEHEGSPEFHANEAAWRATVDDFWIAKHPVTAAQFCEFLNSEEAMRLAPAILFASDAHWHYKAASMEFADGTWRPRDGADDSPADKVTWLGAVEYSEWLTRRHAGGVRYRLPTEAEWEYMARGASARLWPWGDTPPTPEHGYRWKPHPWNAAKTWVTCAVGSFPLGATPDGVLDVMGYHAAEWCLDVWRDRPTASDNDYVKADLTTPRAARGGFNQAKSRMSLWDAWMSQVWHEGRVWSRFASRPIDAARSSAFQFRLVAELEWARDHTPAPRSTSSTATTGSPDSTIPCIGASGGISGLIASYALHFPRATGSFLWFIFMPHGITYPAWGGFLFWMGPQTLLLWQPRPPCKDTDERAAEVRQR